MTKKGQGPGNRTFKQSKFLTKIACSSSTPNENEGKKQLCTVYV